MKSDVARIREMGFPGLVIGMLDEEAHIDRARMRQIMALCDGMQVSSIARSIFSTAHKPRARRVNRTRRGTRADVRSAA